MCGANAAGMLDRTPVLFCACCNPPEIGRQTVTIGTVEGVEFFYDIKVRQVLPVKHHVLRAFDPWDTVNSEADRLVQG